MTSPGSCVRQAKAVLRRRLLLAGASVTVLPGAGRGEDPGTDMRTTDWLKAWDAQGVHRTGTAGDDAGADWLAEEAKALGGRVSLEDFALDRIDPMRGFVEFDGARVQGLMLFDAPDTPPGGVAGLVSRPEGEGLVALTEVSPWVVYSPGFAAMRRSTKARAIVAVTRGGAPGLALLNAESFRAPYGPAILQVPSEAGEALEAAFARGAAFRVVAESRRVPVRGRNVVVTVAGQDPARPPLVVMTPRSSWWESTSERGGGLVCWLMALRAVLAIPRPGGDVVFTANSGHELGHIGLDDFLARRPGWDRRARWIHFGANIGATGGTLSIVSPDDDLRRLASGALTGIPLAARDTVPNGETRDIHRAGGAYLTLVGTNPLFHLPEDRYPGAVDVDVINRVAAAMAAVVADLAR